MFPLCETVRCELFTTISMFVCHYILVRYLLENDANKKGFSNVLKTSRGALRCAAISRQTHIHTPTDHPGHQTRLYRDWLGFRLY